MNLKPLLLSTLFSPLLMSSLSAEETIERGRSVYDFPAAEERGTISSPAHLFILSGQSNMQSLKPEVSFTPAVVEAFGEDSVIIVKDAMGGQSISRWYKDWKSVNGQPAKFKSRPGEPEQYGGDLYDKLIARVKAATEGREVETITFLWMQGEKDAVTNQVGVYEASLKGLIGQLEKDLGREDLNLVLGRLSDYNLDSEKHPQWNDMRDLQQRFAEESPSREWVNTDDLNDGTDRKTGEPTNGVHYTKEGYEIFGKRLADAAIKLIQNPGAEGEKAAPVTPEKKETAPQPTEETSALPPAPANEWRVDSQAEWEAAIAEKDALEVKDGFATPTAEKATLRSSMKRFKEKKTAQSLVLAQSPVWHNWEPAYVCQPNMANAPIALSCGPDDYWIFGCLRSFENMLKKDVKNRESFEKRNPGKTYEPEYKIEGFQPQPASLEGYDEPLVTTPYPNQFALERLEMHKIERTRGYHGWRSRDMKNWVYYGMISPASLSTSAEYVDGKVYMYYDQPNDRDPHLAIDPDLTDGVPGETHGMVFDAPWGGSDIAVIRDLEGTFHMVSENWQPIDASQRSWDSPLASRMVSADGINDFKFVNHAVDERTTPTGKMATFEHPHWPQAEKVVEYEIHEPEQEAFGDWAAIAIGGQYYLFGDYDKAGAHGREAMSVAWFTSTDISKPFTRCGEIGEGHPDPDIMYAEDQFYLITQMGSDFVSPGPWVESVEVRVGVDEDNDGTTDQWTDWQEVKESYDYTPGFAKQIAKAPADLDLSTLPTGYGFQFELRLTDTTENESKPILDSVRMVFE